MITIKVEHVTIDCPNDKLDLVVSLLQKIQERLNTMAQELDDLKVKVAANGTVIGSAITLLQGLKAKLDAAGTDPAALKALSDSLGSQDTALADAITQNTPSA